jgi:hypothetical protein
VVTSTEFEFEVNGKLFQISQSSSGALTCIIDGNNLGTAACRSAVVSEGLTFIKSGRYLSIGSTELGFRFIVNGRNVYIDLSEEIYGEKVRGYCGNFDGVEINDAACFESGVLFRDCWADERLDRGRVNWNRPGFWPPQCPKDTVGRCNGACRRTQAKVNRGQSCARGELKAHGLGDEADCNVPPTKDKAKLAASQRNCKPIKNIPCPVSAKEREAMFQGCVGDDVAQGSARDAVQAFREVCQAA